MVTDNQKNTVISLAAITVAIAIAGLALSNINDNNINNVQKQETQSNNNTEKLNQTIQDIKHELNNTQENVSIIIDLLINDTNLTN